MAENNTMKNKQRLLRLLRYLYENTDEDHPVKTPELVEIFSDQNAHAKRKTLQDDIRILEDFADFAGGGLKYVSKEQAGEIGHKLYEALQGRGAFRRFKNTLNYYGIADEYYAYRHIYYVELAKEWCQDHEIGFVRE